MNSPLSKCKHEKKIQKLRCVICAECRKVLYYGQMTEDPELCFHTSEVKCKKCHDTGWYGYGDNHATVCDKCCKHDQGFWFLTEHYYMAGNWCCLAGCGYTLPFNPDAKE